MPPDQYPGIADPAPDVESLYTSVQQIKQVLESISGRSTGDPDAAMVSWNDLLAMGIITAEQLPSSQRARYGV